MTKDKARFDIMMLSFAKRKGLTNFEKDEGGEYRLTIEGFDINCFLHSARVYLECDFGVKYSGRPDQDIPLESLLQQALVSLGERRETLTIDAAGLLALWRSIDIRELNIFELEQVLSDFVESAEFYGRFLQPALPIHVGLRH